MKNLKSLEVQETNLDNSFVQSIGQWTSLQDLILVKFVETNPGQFLQGWLFTYSPFIFHKTVFLFTCGNIRSMWAGESAVT